MSTGLGSLFDAVLNGNPDAVKELIKKGVDINIMDSQSQSAKQKTSSLSAAFNHAASGAGGPAPHFDPPPPAAPRVFDPDKVEMKTKRKITAPRTAQWRKKGRGGHPDARSKQGKDRKGGGKPPGA